MNIIISNTGGKPIYDQIKEQIKNAVLAGELRSGDALPSIRMPVSYTHLCGTTWSELFPAMTRL